MPLAISLILRFILLLAVQILVLDNIQFLGYINPMIYILFIISLPVKFPVWISLLLAFIMGFIIDIFSNTLGIHTATVVLLAFIRFFIIKLFVSIEDIANPTPSFNSFGINNYIKYVTCCVVFHHSVLFFLESFSFTSFPFIVLKIIISSFITLLIILILQSFKSK